VVSGPALAEAATQTHAADTTTDSKLAQQPEHASEVLTSPFTSGPGHNQEAVQQGDETTALLTRIVTPDNHRCKHDQVCSRVSASCTAVPASSCHCEHSCWPATGKTAVDCCPLLLCRKAGCWGGMSCLLQSCQPLGAGLGLVDPELAAGAVLQPNMYTAALGQASQGSNGACDGYVAVRL
jgi:hypothetical protein